MDKSKDLYLNIVGYFMITSWRSPERSEDSHRENRMADNPPEILITRMQVLPSH
jgi:hypothetical protein